MLTCIFAGHREVYQSSVAMRINEEMEKLLQMDTAFHFLTGGMGQFDAIGSEAVRAAKRRYPEKHITLTLVLPYMSNRLNNDKEYYQSCYDQIIIPQELHTAHYKAAIRLRNHWMVEQADVVIAYIYREFGGAFATVRYARKCGKPVINLAQDV